MLNCTAMCRSMDKKPCDNILKSPIKSVFAANALLNRLGGGVMNQNTAINSSVETVTNGLEQKVAVNLGFAKPSASIARSFSVINGSAAIAGIDKGNLFAPLPGNRHRITGLIQRKSVV